MRTDRLEQTALVVMLRMAVSQAQNCVDQGVPFLYYQLAAASVRGYIDACHVPFVLPPAVRSQYEDEVRRHMLAEGARRSWPVH